MPLTITLRRETPDRAAVLIDGDRLASFEPAALRGFKSPPADPQAYGQRLLAALGGDTFLERFKRLRKAPNPDSLIAVESGDAELAAIPWEYLYAGAGFVILDYLFVRVVRDADLPDDPDPRRPWRLVALGSDPLLRNVYDPKTGKLVDQAPMRPLTVVAELDRLGRSLHAQQPPPPIRWQRIAPTQAALIDLAVAEPMLLHYTGHGDVLNGRPVLCFDDGTGLMDPQPAGDLGAELRGRTYFAFLNACRTADAMQPGANLALSLVESGIPVVLGTQFPIPDEVAADCAWTVYQHLAAGATPGEAVWRARRKLRAGYPAAPALWGIPALYLAAGYRWPRQTPPDAPLKPVEAPPVETKALRAPETLLGREHELWQIARLFVKDKKRIVTILGAGGMGKTALASALAERLRYHFPRGVYALALVLPKASPLLSAAVRRELAALLGVQDQVFDDPNAVAAQEAALLDAVADRERLLIFDNYETVLWRLGRDRAADEPEADPAERGEADAVQRLVTRLAQASVALLFTSRQAPVGLPDEAVYPPPDRGGQLGGLGRDASSALFLRHSSGKWSSEDFRDRLAAAVGDSPLAIILAASRWRESHQTEAEFLQHIADELIQAVLNGVPPNQASAEANVRLSINDLPADRRRDFLALAVVANPLIGPIHGAVIWGLEDEEQWFTDQAHDRLQRFYERLLLQGAGWDDARHRPEAYTFQPMIAQIAGRLAQAEPGLLDAARGRYAQWVRMRVDRAFGDKGIRASEEVVRSTQAMLPDIAGATPYLPEAERGWTVWEAATIFRQLGDPVEAGRMVDLARTTAEATNDQPLLGRALHEQAEQAIIAGDLDRALERLRDALAVHKAQGDERNAAATQHAMAGVLETRGDLDGALALYQQSLDAWERLGDLRGKAATQHALAGVLVTRGDLDGALALYQQSLDAWERLGNLHGKAMTLGMAGQLLWRQGQWDRAREYLREAVRLLESMGGTAELPAVRATLAAMEGAEVEPAGEVSPARLAAILVKATTDALRDRQPRDQLRRELEQLGGDGPLQPFIVALGRVVDGAVGAADTLLAAAGPLLAEGAPAEVANAYAGIGNIAHELGDSAAEIAARQRAITALRQAGTDRETLVNLSVLLYNLASVYIEQNDYAAAVPLLEEVVALDERTGHADLASDRAALEATRQRAAGQPAAPLVAAIETWKADARDEASFAQLLNLVCNLVVTAVRDGEAAARMELAADLALIRAARPLPIAGANDFLLVLQLWLRDLPGMAEQARQVRAVLPEGLAGALTTMERLVAGVDAAPDASAAEETEETEETEEAAMAAALAALPPEQRAELEVLTQVFPTMQQAAQMMHDPATTPVERVSAAVQFERMAQQAAEGEAPGSPWRDAAAALRAVAALLRGGAPNLAVLTPTYRQLLEHIRDGGRTE